MTDARASLAAALSDRYRIERALGSGGMATVWLAEDLKHDRKVAIKVLKPELTAVLGGDRFVQEIKTTAALSHPHILPLFDSGTADGFLFYVMPYLEGETVREKLNREKQLGVEDAVKIATEVADALDYAHRHGIIHRDIKPENILLHDGRPMVMDFGIALAVSAAAGGRMTETGLSLGTPHYMSPEQATADREITAKSDIYSLASVLYEMLAGVPPHEGGTAQQTIMRIIADTPRPVSELRRSVSPNVAAAVMKALEKLPADRFESAKAFSEALSDPHFTTAIDEAIPKWTNGPRGVPIPVFATVVVLLAAIGAAGWLARPAVPDARVVRFLQPAPPEGRAFWLDVSPDGSRVVYQAGLNDAAYIRALDDDSARLLLSRGFRAVFSSNGREILTTERTVDRRLMVTPLDGGTIRTLNADVRNNNGLFWGGDGFIYLGLETGGIVRLTEAGGDVDTLIAGGHTDWPEALLPDGRGLVFTRAVAGGDAVMVLDLGRRTSSELFRIAGGSRVQVAPAGHLVYAEKNRLLARRFDAGRNTVGDPLLIAQVEEGAGFAFGLHGTTLAFARQTTRNVLMLVDRQGRPRTLDGVPPGTYRNPAVSPDGRRIAVQHSTPGETAGDIWIYDRSERLLNRLTGTADADGPQWMPDGVHVGYRRETGVFRRAFDGSGDEERLLPVFVNSFSFLPDGRRIAFERYRDIGIATLGDSPTDSLFTQTDAWEGNPVVSPDGRWLAYYSTESGPPEIFVRPISGTGRQVRVSRRGGLVPRWSRDGRDLFFQDGSTLMDAKLEFDPGISVSSITPLFDLPMDTGYDVLPGDSLFVVNEPPAQAASQKSEITIITNVDVLLRRLEARAR